MNTLYKYSLGLALVVTSVTAKENVNQTKTNTTSGLLGGRLASGDCTQATASADLDINNVRTKILTAGDMWWDPFQSIPKYEIPKGSKRNSLFAGSLWIGGYDAAAGGNLKVAAMTYRQSGVDFWPGPLTEKTAEISKERCDHFDKIFQITRTEADATTTSPNVLSWPGNGNVNDAGIVQSSFGEESTLAPYRDANNNGIYDPAGGDRPKFFNPAVDTAGCKSCGTQNSYVYGDKALWWVFNDKGNTHQESKSASALGIEIHAQAFAFTTDDEINDMTFYQYEIINRSPSPLYRTYFAQWVDPDLGYANDDLVGCDVARGLGYVWNSDDNDEGAEGYGTQPPALGVDFFQGPLADGADGIDNNKDGIIDEPCEEIIMSRFVYYNNDASPVNGNPSLTKDFYNYMNGLWRDGTSMKYPDSQNGAVVTGNGTTGAQEAKYMFPGNSDAEHPNNPWEDGGTASPASDRRFLQSAGIFTMQPGAHNYITTGVVWARDPSGSRRNSVSLIKAADDKAQRLFDNCFKVVDGPAAPTLGIQELNRKIILTLLNTKVIENYNERDPVIVPSATVPPLYTWDPNYKFQGYKIYQLRSADVTASELEDASVARLAFQCDLKDGITDITNYEFDRTLGGIAPKTRVKGGDNGIKHSFAFSTDLFASGASELVNHKNYYFMVVSYSYNNFKQYKLNVAPVVKSIVINGTTKNFDTDAPAFNGQAKPYLQGRTNVSVYTGIPHLPNSEFGGTKTQADYGDGVEITRLSGRGNGGNVLEFTDETLDKIVETGFMQEPLYKQGKGPLTVKVIDPLRVVKADYTVEFMDPVQNKKYAWQNVPSGSPSFSGSLALYGIYNFTNTVCSDSALFKVTCSFDTVDANGNTARVTTVYTSNKMLRFNDEYIVEGKGIAITVGQVQEPGPNGRHGYGTTKEFTYEDNDGFISSSIEFENKNKPWLTGVANVSNGTSPRFWIRGGTIKGGFQQSIFDANPSSSFQNVVNGTWGPMPLCYIDAKAPWTSPADNLSSAQPGLFDVVVSGAGLGGANDMSKLSPYRASTLSKLSSVTVIITADKTKWTRCPVINTMDYAKPLVAGMPNRYSIVRKPSVDKIGNAATGGVSTDPENAGFVSDYGMGWFPGYAVNLETGERLNMIFGEDTTNAVDNGYDMKWNPTSSISAGSKQVWGGRHFVYVLGVNAAEGAPRYQGDFGKWAFDLLKKQAPTNLGTPFSNINFAPITQVLRDAMWVNVPLLVKGYSVLDCNVKININVAKPYAVGYNTVVNNTSASNGLVVGAPNNNYPSYKFNTSKIATIYNDKATAEDALNFVKIVPNPYYAYSEYEYSQIDTRVKITNLPDLCTVSIYTTSGMLVRKFERDVTKVKDYSQANLNGGYNKLNNTNTDIDWDIKNSSGVPIASGMYIIHIKDNQTGKEKTVKWLGVLRPIDLDNF
ncbi:MAG: hypothetical protein H7331_01995 [Bacteroidia bacterium]|nr:hypothetical protein [Bacteroidia bacterium]